MSLGGDTRLRLDSNGLYVSDDAGSNWTEVIKNESGSVKMFADVLKAGEIVTEKLADLGVTTGKLANNAATYTATYWASGSTSLGTGYSTIASATISATNKTVFIHVSCRITTAAASIQLSGGGLGTVEWQMISAGQFSAVIGDTSPGSGNVTYYLKAMRANPTFACEAERRAMLITEFRK